MMHISEAMHDTQELEFKKLILWADKQIQSEALEEDVVDEIFSSNQCQCWGPKVSGAPLCPDCIANLQSSLVDALLYSFDDYEDSGSDDDMVSFLDAYRDATQYLAILKWKRHKLERGDYDAMKREREELAKKFREQAEQILKLDGPVKTHAANLR